MSLHCILIGCGTNPCIVWKVSASSSASKSNSNLTRLTSKWGREGQRCSQHPSNVFFFLFAGVFRPSACLYRFFDMVGSWGRGFMVCDVFQRPPSPSPTLTPYKQLLSGLNGVGCTPLTLISIPYCPSLMRRLTPSGPASHGAILSKGICSLCGEALHSPKNGLPK